MSPSLSLILMYSNGLPPPAFRMVSWADWKCLPLQHSLMRFGDDLSAYFTKERSPTATLPEPPPVPECAEPDCRMDQLHERTSISSLCEASTDSPLMSSIFM